ncbi:MAG: toll/interleukin-1 receptor domain-containing protein, partial [Acidocella sp.]|nr:toll/interleukin-1 receptor domain-containing protein [Acidocella sp.]
MAHDVFISYSKQDKPVADAVCAVLEANHIRCWIAPRDILPSADWGESIIDALASAHAMVLVFSAWANASPQVKREVERAVHLGIPIIPLRIEDVEPTKSLEFFLSMPHWLDAFTEPMERHLQYLVEVLQRVLNGPARSSPAGETGETSATHTEPAAPPDIKKPDEPPHLPPITPKPEPVTPPAAEPAKPPITVLEPVTQMSHFEAQVVTPVHPPPDAPPPAAKTAPAQNFADTGVAPGNTTTAKPSRRGLLIAAAGAGAVAGGGSALLLR